MIRDGKGIRRTRLAVVAGGFWGFFALFWVFMAVILSAAMLAARVPVEIVAPLAVAIMALPVGPGIGIFAILIRPNVAFQETHLRVRNVLSLVRIPYAAIAEATVHNGLEVHLKDGSVQRPFAFRYHPISGLFDQGKPTMVAAELARRASVEGAERQNHEPATVTRSGIVLLILGFLLFIAGLLTSVVIGMGPLREFNQ